ncbi:hypothetical protein ACVTNA_30765, partial [Escherichia coli]
RRTCRAEANNRHVEMFHLFTHIHHDGKRLLSESEVLVKYDGGTRFVSGPRHETDNLCSP